MDSVSQAALGAAIGEAVLGSKTAGKGAVAGAIVATIPDLDVVLYLFYDKLEMLSIHRGFSHSIVFSFMGAFLIAYLLSRFKWTSEVSILRLWLFAWLALFTHILLDAFTAYGTQLFLPFSDERAGLDSINVVDPVYTIPLLAGLLLSRFVFKSKPKSSLYNYLGLGISTLYLIGTLGIKSQVEQYFRAELSEQGIAYQALLTMPVGSAGMNWYGVAKTDDSLFMQQYTFFDDRPAPFESFPINDHLLEGLNPEVVEKMRWFAKGFYSVQKDGDKIRFYNLQVDMRGITPAGDHTAPTKGYFEIISHSDGGFELSSGTV